MDRFAYVAATGSEQIMQLQSMNLHNLANVNTPGFRADLARFEAQAVQGDGMASRVYSVAKGNSANFDAGVIRSTGRDLDIAIEGDGWIAVEGKDGQEAYTRAGNFNINADGMLVTSSGKFVIGNGGPISIPPAERLAIGRDGVISVQPAGQGPESLAQLDRIKLTKPDQLNLIKGDDGFFYLEDGGTADADPEVSVVPGAIEGSNVDAVGSLISVMELSRQYEVQVKLMEEAKNLDQSSAQIMHIN